MQKGKNSVMIACTLEILNTLKEFSSKVDQNEGYHLAKRLLMNDAEFKARFIEKYGQEVYNQTVLHYSKTNIVQRAERELKDKEKAIREDAKQKIEELKANAYAKQTENVTDEKEQIKEKKQKQALNEEIRQLEAEKESLTKLLSYPKEEWKFGNREESERRLKEVTEKLKESKEGLKPKL